MKARTYQFGIKSESVRLRTFRYLRYCAVSLDADGEVALPQFPTATGKLRSVDEEVLSQIVGDLGARSSRAQVRAE